MTTAETLATYNDILNTARGTNWEGFTAAVNLEQLDAFALISGTIQHDQSRGIVFNKQYIADTNDPDDIAEKIKKAAADVREHMRAINFYISLKNKH